MFMIYSKGKHDLKCSEIPSQWQLRGTQARSSGSSAVTHSRELCREAVVPPRPSHSPLLKTLPNWPVFKTKLSSCVRCVEFKHHTLGDYSLCLESRGWTFTTGTRVGRGVPKEQQRWAARAQESQGMQGGRPDIHLLETSSLHFMQ